MSKFQEPYDEYRSKQRYLSYLSEDYEKGKISLDKYMTILENNYEFLDLQEMKEVNEWRLKKDKDIATKKSQEAFRKKQRDKETEDLTMYIVIIGSSILLIIIWLFG